MDAFRPLLRRVSDSKSADNLHALIHYLFVDTNFATQSSRMVALGGVDIILR